MGMLSITVFRVFCSLLLLSNSCVHSSARDAIRMQSMHLVASKGFAGACFSFFRLVERRLHTVGLLSRPGGFLRITFLDYISLSWRCLPIVCQRIAVWESTCVRPFRLVLEMYHVRRWLGSFAWPVIRRLVKFFAAFMFSRADVGIFSYLRQASETRPIQFVTPCQSCGFRVRLSN